MIRNFTSVTKLYDMNNNVEAYVIVENDKTSYVPLDEANTDYQAIQEWIADGGTVIDNLPE
jgi:predicted P-loop ATPase/GTPase